MVPLEFSRPARGACAASAAAAGAQIDQFEINEPKVAAGGIQ
jgi:hypothetical protein